MKKGLTKGSDKAKSAGAKAAETRARNRALNSKKEEIGTKAKNVSVAKVTFKKLDESDYHTLEIDVPCRIFISKKLSKMYISPTKTKLS